MDAPYGMFHTHSPYSPFFTSGLLSARRGSLPTDSQQPPPPPSSSALYPEHYLDLAESLSMRSASLHRTAGPDPRRVAEVPLPPTPVSAAPLRLRCSRDSLRTIPSPKPAPCITLPAPPASAAPKLPATPPRLPSIQLSPALDFSFPAVPTHIPTPRHSLAAPSPTPPRLRLNTNTSGARHVAHRVSVATKASSSTVSTRARRYNRSEALARLEGRPALSFALRVPFNPNPSPASRPLPLPHKAKRNFMSMTSSSSSSSSSSSDDDDADGDNIEDEEDLLSDLESLDFEFPHIQLVELEEEDVVLPAGLHASPQPTRTFLSPHAYPEPALPSAPLLTRSSSRSPSPFSFRGVYPRLGASASATDVTQSQSRTRKLARNASRREKEQHWFPLTSFIDLHTDRKSKSKSKSKSAGNSSRSSVEKPNLAKSPTLLAPQTPAPAMVHPPPRTDSRSRASRSLSRTNSKEAKAKDAKRESKGWAWRSFIEVAGVV